MPNSNHARRERQLMVDLLRESGPDAPTLCEGWTTRDLAAHLVVRERRVDAAGGIMMKSLANRLARVQAEFATKPYGELLHLIKSGPPKFSLFGIPGADEAGNTVEYFVHNEDVRRARPDWTPRELDAAFSEALWKRLSSSARISGRQSPVGLVLRTTDGRTAVANKGTPVVTATGQPGELLMFVMGRQAKANVELDGEPGAVERARSAKLGL